MSTGTIPLGKQGNKDFRKKLDEHLDRVETGEETCRVIIHVKKGELMKCEMAVPKVFGKID